MCEQNAAKSKRPRRGVTFNEEEIVINPEDIDPAVGRFRNLIQTTVVPTKRMKFDMHPLSAHQHNSSATANHHHHSHQSIGGSNATDKQSNSSGTNSSANLYHDLPPTADTGDTKSYSASGELDLGMGIGSKFGMILPNPAPEVETISPPPAVNSAPSIYAGVSPVKSECLLLSLVIINTYFLSSFGGKFVDSGAQSDHEHEDDGGVPRKKKYAKEAWPGRKPLLSSF